MAEQAWAELLNGWCGKPWEPVERGSIRWCPHCDTSAMAHRIGVARDAERQQHQQMIHERIRLHDLVLEVLAAWSESENEDDIVKRARVRTAFRERLRSGGRAEHQQTIQQQAAQIATLTQALEQAIADTRSDAQLSKNPIRAELMNVAHRFADVLRASRPTEGGN